MAYLKTAAIVIGLVLVAYGGWTVNNWRTDAARAKALADQLTAETRLRVETDAARLTLERDLAAARDQVASNVKTVTKTITKYVVENPDCDLPDGVASQLQRLREGDLSNAAR